MDCGSGNGTRWNRTGLYRSGACPTPEEHRMVSTCYNPFFKAADEKDQKAMLGVLSEGTIQHFEKNVFTDPKEPSRTGRNSPGLRVHAHR